MASRAELSKKLRDGIKSGEIKVLQAGVGSPGKAAAQAVGKVAEKAIESFSKSGKDLTKAENRAVAQQNKAAGSYKTTDLGRSESAKAGAETRKVNENTRLQRAYDTGKDEGNVQGIVKAAVSIGATVSNKKGTQMGHHVTDSKNHTRKVKGD
jgi:hypothetical protein